MTLANAKHWRNGAYPMLSVEVDGRVAVLSAECKPATFDAGYTMLGPAFDDVLDPIVFTPEGSAPVELVGATADPRVHRLYAAFLTAANSGDFAEGPVEIPA